MKRYAVIVDAYSAGNLLAPEFKARGVSCLHVQSTKEIWPILSPSFRESDFDVNLKFGGELGPILGMLRSRDVVCVVPGTETGVELADQIAEGLGLPTANGTRLSPARRDKFLMGEAVRAAGLRAAKQFRSASPADSVGWFRASGLSRVVVKPVKSAGTDNVRVCASEAEVLAASEAIFGTVNMLGLANSGALVMEYLEGTEYFIDTVSLGGKHAFTDLWRYRKRSINGHDCVYDANELLPHDGAVETPLREYVSGVLDAIGIANGPAHTEVILTAEGPVLVESGARLDGLSVPSVNTEAIGHGPVGLTADAYLEPGRFQARPYVLKKQALTVYLTSYREGVLTAIPGEAALRALPSFFQARIRAKPGARIEKTTDYFTAPGFVSLVHADRNTILGDYETIRRMERDDALFTIA